MASPGFWDDTERAPARLRPRPPDGDEDSALRDPRLPRRRHRGDDGAGRGGGRRLHGRGDRGELESVREDLDALRLTTLLNGEYDGCNALLSLHAGAGGTEAQDWTQMLYRMYVRYAERMGFKVREIDLLDGDEAGIKSVTFEVDGDYAYGYLKAERGVHRLVRISPFDANARRHTSFASLDVAPIIEDDGEIEIRPEDLRIDTYRASGAGGQHVNRTDSPCASPTCPRAWWCSARTSARRCRTRRPASACCAPSWPNSRKSSGRSRWATSRRTEEDRVGQPDTLLRLPALHDGQRPAHGLRDGRRLRRDGRQARGLCHRLSANDGRVTLQVPLADGEALRPPCRIGRMT